MHKSVILINEIMKRPGKREKKLIVAAKILHQVTIPSLGKVRDSLYELRKQIAERRIGGATLLSDAHQAHRNIIWSLVSFIIITLFVGFLLAKEMTGRTKELVRMAEQLAKGDYSSSWQSSNKDEFGQLTNMMGKIVDNFTKAFREIDNSVHTMLASSGNLDEHSLQLTKEMDAVVGESHGVATAAEEMSTNISTVATATEQSSTNIQIVAERAGDMRRKTAEIAGLSGKTQEISRQAANRSRQAVEGIASLSESANEISKVTSIITEISEQTNLLALNATIEAARAGEAGKGFAVVANEIKELARQTANATHEIRQKIEGIQQATDTTVNHIKQVSSSIDETNVTISDINTAVEEQAVATEEIADNIEQAATGLQEVTSSVAEVSTVSADIASEIGRVDLAVQQIDATGIRVELVAEDLHTVGARLQKTSGLFTIRKPLFDIGAVKNAHLGWRTKLEAVLRGKTSLEEEKVVGHQHCDFGKWYFSEETASLQSEPVFLRLGEHHEKVHTLAQEVVRCYNNREEKKAEGHFHTFKEECNKFLAELDELYLH